MWRLLRVDSGATDLFLAFTQLLHDTCKVVLYKVPSISRRPIEKIPSPDHHSKIVRISPNRRRTRPTLFLFCSTPWKQRCPRSVLYPLSTNDDPTAMPLVTDTKDVEMADDEVKVTKKAKVDKAK